MKKVFLFVVLSLILTQCDDGNFDEPSFVFENNIDTCGNLIIVNIGTDDSEALILNIDADNIDDLFFKTAMTEETFDLTNQITYRVFDGNVAINYFCQDIPPTSPSIVNEWNGSGTLVVTNTIINDDKDGVEESDHDLDRDSDGIKNYLDIDDDNDGILTADEIEIDDEGNIIFTDTDSDGTPDYLDTDDDGDGIDTIKEFIIDSDGNDGNEVPDYLDSGTAEEQTERAQIPNKYTLSYTTTFVIQDMSLHNTSGNAINYSNYEYGVKTGSFLISN